MHWLRGGALSSRLAMAVMWHGGIDGPFRRVGGGSVWTSLVVSLAWCCVVLRVLHTLYMRMTCVIYYSTTIIRHAKFKRYTTMLQYYISIGAGCTIGSVDFKVCASAHWNDTTLADRPVVSPMLYLWTRYGENATFDVCVSLNGCVGSIRSFLKHISLHSTPFLLELTLESGLDGLTIDQRQSWPLSVQFLSSDWVRSARQCRIGLTTVAP